MSEGSATLKQKHFENCSGIPLRGVLQLGEHLFKGAARQPLAGIPRWLFGTVFQLRGGTLSNKHRCGAEFITPKTVPRRSGPILTLFVFLLLLQLAWDDGINTGLHSSVAPPFAGHSCLICTKRLLTSALSASQNCWSSQLTASANRLCCQDISQVRLPGGEENGKEATCLRAALLALVLMSIQGLSFTKAFIDQNQSAHGIPELGSESQ